MTTDELLYRELCQSVIGVFYQVFNELGLGFWRPHIAKPCTSHSNNRPSHAGARFPRR